jgi:hypothetical protein
MRLQFVGSTIASSAPATTKQLLIDGMFVLTKFDPIQSVDTNTVYALEGRFLPDSSLSNAGVNFTLDNDQSSYT